MTGSSSLYWYDLETFGLDPKSDRISQFAGVRTDLDLNVIDKPLVAYCKPANDMLPSPESCLITGITPQKALAEGILETEFIARINTEFTQPNTCVAGYNNIRFDDEFMRYGLYRNFLDPYEREWKNGNSRWDIIDMVRLTRALRPEGIEWPVHDDGLPSFRLEELTVANGIEHEQAHDALSDVYATIAIAKLIKDRQPRLYNYIFSLRSKHQVFEQLNVREQEPVLHVSGMFSSKYFCTSLVVPIVSHPTNKNGIIVYDLRDDPTPMFDCSVEEIRRRVFTARQDLPEDVSRIGLKTIHANKCPIIAPLKTMDDSARERTQLDLDKCLKNLALIKKNKGLRKKLLSVFGEQSFTPSDDPDKQLYQGFFSAADKQVMQQVRSLDAGALAAGELFFNDKRLPELFFRYRARNFPETLSDAERRQWDEFRIEKLTDPDEKGVTLLDDFNKRLNEAAADTSVTAAQQNIIEALRDYAITILPV